MNLWISEWMDQSMIRWSKPINVSINQSKESTNNKANSLSQTLRRLLEVGLRKVWWAERRICLRWMRSLKMSNLSLSQIARSSQQDQNGITDSRDQNHRHHQHSQKTDGSSPGIASPKIVRWVSRFFFSRMDAGRISTWSRSWNGSF